MKAAEDEEKAKKNAEIATNNANAYQIKVNELSLEIAGKELEIAETTIKIEDLSQQITKKEEKLNDEQAALAELLIKMHFDSNSEPIIILVGSESISDLAEKTARREVVKEQISAVAKQIKIEKEELEQKKNEVEKLLAELEEVKADLVARRKEQQAIVAKYANDAEAYEAVAAEARQREKEAEEEYQRQHPENSNTYAGAYNSYPWQDQCPNYYYNDYYINEDGNWVKESPSVYVYTKINPYGRYIAGTRWENPGSSIIGGVLCQCTSYAGWKMYENYGIIASWGDAKDWARNTPYYVDNNPAPGTVGQATDGPFGHVFWVEGVNSDGSINITEYNSWWGTYYYSGVGSMGDFGARTIDKWTAANYNYIHFN